MRTTPLLLACAVLTMAACSEDDAASSSVSPSASSVTTLTTDSPAGTTVATDPPPTGIGSAAASPVSSAAPLPSTPVTELAPAPGYPAQPEGVPFPSADWPVAPLPPGVDQATLDAAVARAFGAPDATSTVRSVVVVQGGAIVYERYHPTSGSDVVMSSYSVAKSFTATLVGMLVEDGLLDVDEPVSRPEWPVGDPRREITLRHLLQMSSGLQWDEATSLATLGLSMLQSPSAAAVMASQPLERQPGTAFEYSTGTSALVAGIAADALGGCAELDAYLRGRLLEPIGITTASVMTDGGGCFVGGIGMDMTSRDFARFGLLNVRGGRWDGEQVVPTDWIDEERVPSPTNPQYGLHWWLSASGAHFVAAGLGGQRLAVVPAADLVVVVNTALGNDGPVGTLLNEIGAAFGAPA